MSCGHLRWGAVDTTPLAKSFETDRNPCITRDLLIIQYIYSRFGCCELSLGCCRHSPGRIARDIQKFMQHRRFANEMNNRLGCCGSPLECCQHSPSRMIHHIQKSLQREKLVIKNGWGAVGTPLGFSGHPPGRMSPRRQKSLQRGILVFFSKMVGVLSALPWGLLGTPPPGRMRQTTEISC